MPTTYLFPTHRNAITAGGQALNITLKHRGPQLGAQDADGIAASVVRAVEMLERALAFVMGASLPEALQARAEYIFRRKLRMDDVLTLQRVYRLTLQGLSADPTLKLGTGQNLVLGRVSGISTLKLKHAMRDPETNEPWDLPNGRYVRRKGTIHISKRQMADLPNRRSISVVHEATHKYANTHDFGDKGYWDYGAKTYRNEDLKHGEAMQNADSFAIFAYDIEQYAIAQE